MGRVSWKIPLIRPTQLPRGCILAVPMNLLNVVVLNLLNKRECQGKVRSMVMVV